MLPEVLTVRDALLVALERLEDYLIDVYENGRTIGDPLVIWANGASQMLREILDCFPFERLAVDVMP